MNLTETKAGKNGRLLRESNTKKLSKFQTLVEEAHRRQVMRSYKGLDIADPEIRESLDLSSPGFSIKEFRTKTYAFLESIGVREADMEGGLQQLLRVGIQTAVNKEYQAVETNYEEWCQVLTSSKAIELYAPLYRAGYMAPMDEGDEAPQVGAQGADIQIRNKQFGAMFNVSRNAINDDQTGQLQEQAAQIGENGKILKDSRVYVRWLSVTAQASLDAGNSPVPASATGALAGESTWPWNTSFTNGGGKNRLTAYLPFSYQALLALRQLGRVMKDPKGNRMAVHFDTLLCGSAITDPAEILLKSENWPSSSSVKVPGAGTSDTGLGTTYAKNILQGALNLSPSIWLPDTAYGLQCAGKGFTLQQREPLSVEMENPLSGPSFSARMFRYWIGERYEAEWREPRFAALGNDGSIT